MDDLKVIVAVNISRLRKDSGMTQAELAEKINYSDKSVSKWERAEALPDLSVTKKIADLFGVPVDFLLESHDAWDVEPPEPNYTYDSDIITLIVMLGIFSLSVLIFLVLFFTGIIYWHVFTYAVGALLITLLVLNNCFRKRRFNLLIVSGIVLWVFATIYLVFLKANLWQLIFLLVLAEIIVFLSFHIKRRSRKSKY